MQFVLVNMGSLGEAEKFEEEKSLKGNTTHVSGRPPAAYGITYIPHKVLLDGQGNVVKNGTNLSLPGDLDAVLETAKEK